MHLFSSVHLKKRFTIRNFGRQSSDLRRRKLKVLFSSIKLAFYRKSNKTNRSGSDCRADESRGDKVSQFECVPCDVGHDAHELALLTQIDHSHLSVQKGISENMIVFVRFKNGSIKIDLKETQ